MTNQLSHVIKISILILQLKVIVLHACDFMEMPFLMTKVIAEGPGEHSKVGCLAARLTIRDFNSIVIV